MIRLAKTEDLNNITDVYSYARKFMAENGNPTQWGTNYPSEQLIENDDIEKIKEKCNLFINDYYDLL